MGEEADAVDRIERPQHAGIGGDPPQCRDRDRHKPDRHDRPEQRRHLRRAPRLEREEHDQDRDGQRHHIGVQCRRRDVDAFDGREDRQRRRNHGVAIKQGGADDAKERHDAPCPADTADRARGERHQRERAAFAVVVGAQENEHVFERDDDDQRPQDERQDTEHRGAREVAIAAGGSGHHRFAHRIERARADVAVDDTDAAEGEAPQAGTSFGAAVRRHVARQGSRCTIGHGIRGRMPPAPGCVCIGIGCRAAPIHALCRGVMVTSASPKSQP